ERAETVANSGVQSAGSLKRRGALTLEISPALDGFDPLVNGRHANALRILKPTIPAEQSGLWLGLTLGVARRAVVVGWKGLAIQDDIAFEAPDGLSVLDLYHRNRHLISGLEGIVRPSLRAYGWRSTRLHDPVGHFTAF